MTAQSGALRRNNSTHHAMTNTIAHFSFLTPRLRSQKNEQNQPPESYAIFCPGAGTGIMIKIMHEQILQTDNFLRHAVPETPQKHFERIEKRIMTQKSEDFRHVHFLILMWNLQFLKNLDDGAVQFASVHIPSDESRKARRWRSSPRAHAAGKTRSCHPRAQRRVADPRFSASMRIWRESV